MVATINKAKRVNKNLFIVLSVFNYYSIDMGIKKYLCHIGKGKKYFKKN
jgi:uncharacterized membrane-anchored protein